MKCLVIGSVWPEPNSSAAGENMMAILSGANKNGWQITFACAAQSSIHSVDLLAIGIEQVAIELNSSSFDSFVSKLNPDIVIFDRFMTEEQFGWRVSNQAPHALKILNTEDLHGLRKQSQLEVSSSESIVNQTKPMNDVITRELASVMRCDKTLVISKDELNWLTQKAGVPETQLYYFPLLPTRTEPSHRQYIKSFSERHNVSFIGNFKHLPNWHAVLKLSQLWPQIRKGLPGTECHIYGAYPPKKATDLNNPKTGFHIKGWIDNADDAFISYRVALAPLSFGAGVKGKLIRAIATATPSVASEIAIKGISDEKHWSGMVTRTDKEFIDKVIKLYSQQALWEDAQQKTYILSEQLLAEEKYHVAFFILCKTLHKELEIFRQQHVLSRVLNHQTVRSHQYMSQWIEAKNSLGTSIVNKD